ncbi:MAG TPA: glycosyltransferase [Chthoniobacterales bacterium]|jgi:colanic acid/amylovoran biosynthesis glycosyltransferase
MPKLVVASYCTTFLKSEMLHIYRQVTALREVQTFVMTKKLQNEDRFPFDDIELIPKPRINPLRHGWMKFIDRRPPIVYRGEYQALSNLLDRRGADLMHIYFGHTGVHLLPFIECWSRPCVVSFHGADVMLKAANPEYAMKLRKLFQVAPLILARSRSLEQRLVRLGCPPEKIRINRTGVPLQQFPMVRRTAPRDGAWNFLQACRLIPKKGLTTCLRAFAIFQSRNPQARLYIAGKGPLQPALEILAADLGISSHVHFTGFLSQEKLLDLYHLCHIFMHPSEMPADENQEGIPNSILEAMATGMPVLATRHGGIPEAVEHGRCGALVAERDHEALAEEMKKMTASTETFAEMGALASESVALHFEQHAQIAHLEAHYQEAIEIAEESEAREIVPPVMTPHFPEHVPAK